MSADNDSHKISDEITAGTFGGGCRHATQLLTTIRKTVYKTDAMRSQITY